MGHLNLLYDACTQGLEEGEGAGVVEEEGVVVEGVAMEGEAEDGGEVGEEVSQVSCTLRPGSQSAACLSLGIHLAAPKRLVS